MDDEKPITVLRETIRHTSMKFPKMPDSAYQKIAAMEKAMLDEVASTFVVDSLGTYTVAEPEEETPTTEQILTDMHRIMDEMQNGPPIHLRPYQEEFLKNMLNTDLKMSIDHGGRGHSKSMMLQTMHYGMGMKRYSGLVPSMLILDDPWFRDVEPAKDEVEPDWKRTKFVSGGITAPSADKRAKLRAKRKKKGKSK